jgi:hypothetical protein
MTLGEYTPRTWPKVDWTTEFTPEQWQAIQDQYRRSHSFGMETLETLDRYVLFSYEMIPDALKRFKVLVNGMGGALEPNPAFLVCVFHWYCIQRYNQGIHYYVNTLRANGARKAELTDIIALSWLHSAPFGMNVVATSIHDIMRELDPDAGTGLRWPADWSVDPDAFRSGVEFSDANGDPSISPSDLNLIKDWHMRVEGEIPRYVDFLARHNPLALKAFRARFETSTQRQTLPKQAIASCLVHLASVQQRPDALRRALHMAKSFGGVKKDHMLQLLSLNLVYTGHVGFDAAIEGAERLIDNWE